jgi:ABC-type metal ion transport system substrate-binding protein
MKTRSLFQTNPYLRNQKQYEKLLIANVTTSTAVEIGSISPSIRHALKNKNYRLLIDSGSILKST